MGREGKRGSLDWGRDAFVNGLPLQEMRRKDSQQKCAAAGGWPPALRVWNNRRWVGTVGGSRSTAGRAIRSIRAIFGAREEFIFGGKQEGLLRWPQNW
jgi:hypothetical protein